MMLAVHSAAAMATSGIPVAVAVPVPVVAAHIPGTPVLGPIWQIIGKSLCEDPTVTPTGPQSKVMDQ